MALTKTQAFLLTEEIHQMRAKLAVMKGGVHAGNTYAKGLQELNFLIAALLIYVQVIEQLIRIYLEFQISKRRVLKILKVPDPIDGIRMDMDEKTFGVLIGIVKQVTGSTPLVGKMWFLNNLRVEAAHHIFDGSKDHKSFEKQLGDYFLTGEITNISIGILDLAGKIIDDIEKIAKTV